MTNKCFACDKPLTKPYRANTLDGQVVLVGSDCYGHIKAAGEQGYQPPMGGPKLYPLPDGPFLPARLQIAQRQWEEWKTAAYEWKAERDELLNTLKEITRLRLATDEGSLRVRADRMWEVAEAEIVKSMYQSHYVGFMVGTTPPPCPPNREIWEGDSGPTSVPVCPFGICSNREPDEPPCVDCLRVARMNALPINGCIHCRPNRLCEYHKPSNNK